MVCYWLVITAMDRRPRVSMEQEWVRVINSQDLSSITLPDVVQLQEAWSAHPSLTALALAAWHMYRNFSRPALGM